MNRRITAFAAALLAGLPAAKAVTYNWAGNSAPWNDPNQWLELAVPVSDPAADLIFGGAGGYTSTNDIAGTFTLNSIMLNAANASTIAGNALSLVTDGAVTPSITQNGAGAFTIGNTIDATNALTLDGTGTGLVTLNGVISGGGGMTFTGANWRLTNAANTFTGAMSIGTGAFVELAPPGALSFAVGAATLLGNNAGVTINGGTLKLTTAAGATIALGAARPVVFGGNGGTLDITNALTGNIASGDIAVTLNNTAGNVAVLKFNGGVNGLSSNNAADGNWNTGGNALRFSGITGTGAMRVEVTNGATVRSSAASITQPVVIRGLAGGDPTSGPLGTVNTGLSRNLGRLAIDSVNEHTYTSLTFEGAVQVGVVGTTRALNGSIVVAGSLSGNAGYVDFTGRGTGTQISSTLNAPGTGGAGQNPLWLLRNANGSLTIQDGGIAAFNVRQRTDTGGRNGNGVALDGPAIIEGGGQLRIHQSVSNFTTGVASTVANAGDVIIFGDITGTGTTTKEAVVSIALPEPQAGTTTASTIPFALTATATVDSQRPYGGLRFDDSRGVADFIVNGSGFGGLRIEGIARPNELLSAEGTVPGTPFPDPVGTDVKLNSVLTPARLSRLSGSGGYLTLAPAGSTYSLNPGAVWSNPNVGLKVVDHNPGGVDVSLGAIASWTNNLAVDAGATLDLGAQNPFFFAGPGTLHGKGAITGTGSIFVDTAGSISPGLGDIGTLSIGMPLILSGGLSIGVNNATADTLAVTGALTLGGPLALSGTYGTNDLTIASYTGALSGTFGSIIGLSPDFALDYGTGANSFISLKYTALPTLVWNGNVSANWNTATANWQGGGVFANGGKVLFDDTAAGPNFNVAVSGGDVTPGLVTVTNNSTPYTLISTGGAAIIGSGKLIKNGGGTLTLSGPAAYTGGTDINGGELRLAVANSLPDTGGVTVASGATLNTQGNSDTIGDLTVNGSVTGGGTLTVGALALGSGAAFSPNVVLGGDVTKTGAAGTTLAGTVDLGGATRTFNVAAGGGTELTLNGAVSNGAITKAGNGTLVLGNAGNSQTATTVNAGTLNSLAGIPSGSAVATGSGATLNLTHGAALNFASLNSSGIVNITDAQSLTLGSLSGGGGSLNGANGISLTQGTTTAYAGAITGATSVNMNGTGAITLSGGSNFSGGLFVNSGRVVLAGGTAGGSGITTVNTGGKLGIATALSARVDLAGGTLFAIGAPASIITNNDLVAATGTTSTISLSDPDAPATLSETIFLGTGALKGSGNINVTISGQGSPDGGVGLRLRATGASDYSGTITLGQGVKGEVQVATAGPFSPAGTGKIALTGGAFTGGTLNGNYSVLNVRNNFTGNTTVGNDIVLTGSGYGMINMPGGSAAGSITQMGSLTIGAGQALGVYRNAGNLQVALFPAVTLTGGTATLAPTPFGFNASGVADMWLGPIGESVAGSGIIMDGNSTLSLLGSNTYTGGTTIQHGTTLLGAPGALPSTTDLTVNGGTLDLGHPTAGGYDQIVNSLTGTGGTITNTDATAHSLIVNQAANTTFSGLLAGNLSLDKQNTGTLTLAGTNSHTGITFATVGTLLINGNNGTGTVLVSSGGTLGGTGITGPVQLDGGGILAPGVGTGILNTGDVSLAPGSIFTIELNGAAAGAGYDELNVTGGVTIAANATLSLSLGYNPADNVDAFTIILNDGTDPTAGIFAGLPNNTTFSSGGQDFIISYFDDSTTPAIEFTGGNDVTIQAVPEPAAAFSLIGGLGVLLGLRRRRRA